MAFGFIALYGLQSTACKQARVFSAEFLNVQVIKKGNRTTCLEYKMPEKMLVRTAGRRVIARGLSGAVLGTDRR